MSGSTTYTPSLRLTQPGVNNPSTLNAWGSLLNTDMALIEAAITGRVTVDTAGASTLSLTSNNGATDQSRPFAIVFIDSTSGTVPCAVTMLSVVKFGIVLNQTNHPITLTTGSGANLVLQPLNPWVMYFCDGANVQPVLTNRLFFRSIYSSGSSGSFVTPLNLMKFRLWGAGGAGGAGGGTGAGGGGGGGGYVDFNFAATAGQTVNYSVGTNGPGAGGNVSLNIPSVGVTATAYGGAMGAAGTSPPEFAYGGAGGTTTLIGASGLLSNGQNGGVGSGAPISGTNILLGGAGGGSNYGGTPGSSILAFGTSQYAMGLPGGLSCGGSGGTGNQAGGNGGIAQLIVEW